MEKRLKEHDAEIKAANDMLDQVGLTANRDMHEKINLKTDIIAAKIRVAVLSKYIRKTIIAKGFSPKG